MILALIGLCLSAGAATAQVPHDMAYQGRLTDAVGAPLIGPVNLSMRIYDVIAGPGGVLRGSHPDRVRTLTMRMSMRRSTS